MQILGLDLKTHKFNPTKDKERRYQGGKSQYHTRAKELLSSIFANDVLLEEVTLPGSKVPPSNKPLMVDFFIERVQIGFEIHGQQHYEFSSHFYKSKADFFLAKKRDRCKQEWFDNNDFLLITLSYKDVEIWEDQIQNSL
jgi:hypothetical protein